MASAKEIYQDQTDRASRALWVRDFDTVLTLLALPYRIATQDCDVLHQTEPELRQALVHYRNVLDEFGAQDFHRIAAWAEFDPDNPERIEGEHQTYVLKGGQFVVDRYVSRQVFERVGGIWRGKESHSRVRNAQWAILSPDILSRTGARGDPGTGGDQPWT